MWKCIVWKCKCLDLARHKMRVFDRLHGKSYWKHFLWWDVFFIHLFMTRYITLDISRTFQTWYNFLQSIYYRWVRPYIEIKLSLSIIKLIMYFFISFNVTMEMMLTKDFQFNRTDCNRVSVSSISSNLNHLFIKNKATTFSNMVDQGYFIGDSLLFTSISIGIIIVLGMFILGVIIWVCTEFICTENWRNGQTRCTYWKRTFIHFT